MSNNLRELFSGFVVGASFLSFILFFIGFGDYKIKGGYNKDSCIYRLLNKDPYMIYTILAPLYMGVMSMLAVALSIYTRLSLRMGYLIISLISTILVSITITICDVYNFSTDRYREQYLRLLFYHLFLYNVIIVNVYKVIMNV